MARQQYNNRWQNQITNVPNHRPLGSQLRSYHNPRHPRTANQPPPTPLIPRVIENWIKHDLDKWFYSAMYFSGFVAGITTHIGVSVGTYSDAAHCQLGSLVLHEEYVEISQFRLNFIQHERKFRIPYSDPTLFDQIELALREMYNSRSGQ